MKRPNVLGTVIVVALCLSSGCEALSPKNMGTMEETTSPELAIENLMPGEVVPHDLLVVQGTARGGAEVEVTMRGQRAAWPIVKDQFRALIVLRPGNNDIDVRVGNLTRRLPIVYTPPTNPRFVRFLYVVPADADGSFQAPDGAGKTDQATAVAKLRTTARLIQTFYAEEMRRAGFGRRTFRLARDERHEPIVEVFKSVRTTEQILALDRLGMWKAFTAELSSLPDREQSVDVAMLSLTRFDAKTGMTKGHVAIGWESLALFGNGSLYAHASSLNDVAARFLDATPVNPKLTFDDSLDRATFWANYATGAGLLAHELGHVFSLRHPHAWKGLMARGFDNFNRTFVSSEPPSAKGEGLSPVLPMHESGLDRSSAVRLRYHRWLNPTVVSYPNDEAPTFTVQGTTVTINSKNGLRHVTYFSDMTLRAHDEFLDAPRTEMTVSFDDLKKRTGAMAKADVFIDVIDDAGNIAVRGITLP
ncbi:MAG TPA: hypothetical protein VGF45_18095 [Polyangia bacterium]